MKKMLMVFYKHIKEVKSTLLMCYFQLKVLRYKGYLSSLFEVLIQTVKKLFLNTINILMEYRYNSDKIYQELL